MVERKGERMRNTSDLPPCSLRIGGVCAENLDRCGKKEPYYDTSGRYAAWTWKRYPFFSPLDCWEKIKRPWYRIVKVKNVWEKWEDMPSKCPHGWALDKDTGRIYRFKVL
jgi:hypothetical protein